MGYSLKGDFDLIHNNCWSEEDLTNINDRVMNNNVGMEVQDRM